MGRPAPTLQELKNATYRGVEEAGGTGEMSCLAVAGRTAGEVTNRATAPIGDRVQVRDARIEGRRIVLDVAQAGGRDAACCPGDLVTRTWEFAGGSPRVLAGVMQRRVVAGQLALKRAKPDGTFGVMLFDRRPTRRSLAGGSHAFPFGVHTFKNRRRPR
jgi:hypothetical protein